MRWDDRQRKMLAEMGIRLWVPDEAVVPQTARATTEPQPQSVVSEVVAPSVQAEVPQRRQPAAPVAEVERMAPTRAEAPMRGPRVASVEQMDWPALRDAVSGCTTCKLCEGRRQTVFGIGNEQAHWMIVGEAPGEQEDLQGEPFVGKSGQLLDNMLRAIGLTRADAPPERQVYIANTVKCRPPGNRNPEPVELAQCEPFLIRQIELVKPRIIVAMGRFAVQSLLRSNEPIGRLRGRVHHYQGVPLIVTYHPAYLLRNPEDKARAWDDLCLAMEVLE